jgi:P4 family phage/plasmid primase-like protien
MDFRECNDLSTSDAAVRYARAGLHVVPVWWPNDDGTCACGDAACTNVGKHPLSALVPHGHQQASTDPTWVADWWRQYPRANIGIVCDKSSFLALDVDGDKVLPEDWPDFANNGDAPPRTLVQRSGRADPAYHVLYSTRSISADTRVRGKVAAPGAPGVDKTLIRHNGYIIVSPSVHESGQKYRWLNSEKIADPGSIMLPRLTYTAHGGGGGGENGGSGDGVVNVTSYTDLAQVAVNRAEDGESRAEVGHWLACQLRDNGCARADAERIFLPTFYRETVGMRPDAPDVRIVERWARNAWSTAPRAPLPGFEPAVRTIMDAANGHQAPPQATETPIAVDRTDPPPPAAENGAEVVEDVEDVPVAPNLIEVDEITIDEANNPINATDVGNALRFSRIFKNRAWYVPDVEMWYLWDGNRWKPDSEKRVLSLTLEVINDIRLQAVGTLDPEDRTRWNAWAHQSEGIGHVTAMVKIAASLMPKRISEFDTNPQLLVVENGTVDLRTYQLRASRPEDYCSRQAAVRFDPGATCPKWKDHIRFVSNDDMELARYLWRAIGYTITGETGERAFFFLTGDGSNGKNAFIEPVMSMLGDYGKTASSALLTGGDEQHPTIIADLVGARLVFVDETREGKRLNAERIKTLTGSKRIKARKMREDFFEYEPMFKLWITGNGRPVVRDPSDGAWKRLHEVPCRGKIDDAEVIKDYGEIIYNEEASGILNWALAGLADWRNSNGLDKPQSVQDAIDEHRDEEDFVGQFIDECMIITDRAGYVLPSSLVYEEYARWARIQQLRGENFLSKIHFGRQLAQHLGRSPSAVRRGNKVMKMVHDVAWSDSASAEVRIMTGQATDFSQ